MMQDEQPPEVQDASERRRLLSPVLSNDEFRPLSALVKVEFGAYTRAGRYRTHNDDHYLILRLGRYQEVLASTLQAADLPERFDEQGYAMLVADGAGEMGSGALASRVAISTLAHLAVNFGKWNLRVDARTAESIAQQAEWFYQRAAHAVERQGLADGALSTMSTTLTATFSAGDELFFAHVGHSRAYLFRNGDLVQLTRDHTLQQRVKESGGPVGIPAGANDLRHILTEALGAGKAPPSVDVERIHLLDNDMVLVCSDGLTRVLDDDTIADLLAQTRALNDLCKSLVDLAHARGGDDDATAIVAKYWIPSLREPGR